MGNLLPEKQKKLRSLKDLENDIKIINDIFANEYLIAEIQCLLRAELSSESKNLINKVLYRVLGDIKINLTIDKDNISETIVINLKNFYQLYEFAVSYSLGMSAKKSVVMKPQNNPKEEKKEFISQSFKEKPSKPFHLPEDQSQNRKRSNSLKIDDEANLCSICLEKQIQVILPCMHGFCEDCCFGWYTKKSKTECPMCRTPIGEGDWQEKIFTVISKASSKEGRVNEINSIAGFLNCRTTKMVV